jgi:soluble lytic murein transglycosylase-like protein
MGLALSAWLLLQDSRPKAAAAEPPLPAFVMRDEQPALRPVADVEEPAQRAAADYLSRRYRVAVDAARQLVALAYTTGREVGVDPLLILAVMAVESRLNPIAESVMGAKGLMQIIPRHHADKLEAHGGAGSLLNPAVNVMVGANILKEYIRRSGSVEGALQWYNGSPMDETSQYSEKVMAEQSRLRHAVGRAAAPKGSAV